MISSTVVKSLICIANSESLNPASHTIVYINICFEIKASK